LLNGAGDALAMLGAENESAEDQEVERSLKEGDTTFILSGGHSTRVYGQSGRMSTRTKHAPALRSTPGTHKIFQYPPIFICNGIAARYTSCKRTRTRRQVKRN